MFRLPGAATSRKPMRAVRPFLANPLGKVRQTRSCMNFAGVRYSQNSKMEVIGHAGRGCKQAGSRLARWSFLGPGGRVASASAYLREGAYIASSR